MACDPSEDPDISSLSCLDQCFRVDNCKSFFLAFWFMTSARGTVCPSELSLCNNPARSFWQLCSGRKTLPCLTCWHPLPGCLNSDKISSSWTKYTECESSNWPTFRCLIPEPEIATLGVMQTDLHQLSSAAAWISVFHCTFPRQAFWAGLTWEGPEQNIFPFFSPALLCYNTLTLLPCASAMHKKRFYANFHPAPGIIPKHIYDSKFSFDVREAKPHKLL